MTRFALILVLALVLTGCMKADSNTTAPPTDPITRFVAGYTNIQASTVYFPLRRTVPEFNAENPPAESFQQKVSVKPSVTGLVPLCAGSNRVTCFYEQNAYCLPTNR